MAERPKVVKRLLLIRHGESEWNAAGIIQGQLDSALSEKGREQASALRSMMHRERCNCVYSSDLDRAIETARLATRLSLARIKMMPELRELSFGRWEGLTRDEVIRQYPDDWAAYQAGTGNLQTSCVESVEELFQRVASAISHWNEACAGKIVAAFSHGGAIKAAIIQIFGLSPDRWRTLRIHNTGVTRIDFKKNGPVLRYFDSTGHLSALAAEAAERKFTDEA